MKIPILLCFLMGLMYPTLAQTDNDHLLRDPLSDCQAWYKHAFQEDSIRWIGPCKNGLAEGKGILHGYTGGKETSRYTGAMKSGKFHGEGVFTFWGDRKLAGMFFEGEPLFLPLTLRTHLNKKYMPGRDPDGLYDGDNNDQQLHYFILHPTGKLQGCVVLMPGTWETTAHVLSSMRTFCELAFRHHLAVLVPSINQRLTLNETVLSVLNTMLEDAIKNDNLPRDKFVFGGFSMGGLFSLRYTELSRESASQTAVRPVAAFSCDGPCDLIHIYRNFQRKLNKNPGQNEPAYGIKELEKYCDGNPDQSPQRYNAYSCYAHDDPEKGKAKYLLQVPVRIYADVDPLWWMQNRHVDMYDLNALDQTALIQWLQDQGNKEAEFLQAKKPGRRIEGNRHPHSWSIVDPQDCIGWILRCLQNARS